MTLHPVINTYLFPQNRLTKEKASQSTFQETQITSLELIR